MTMTTTVIVKDPVPVEQLFRFAQSLLGDPDTMEWHHIPPMTPYKFNERYTRPPEPNGVYENRIDQGLAAILHVTYGADGPLVLEDAQDEWTSDEEWADYVAHHSGCVDIYLDTAYGYRGPNGGGCADLHAWLVAHIARWVEDRGARWESYTGEINVWIDNVFDLVKLGDAEKGSLTINA